MFEFTDKRPPLNVQDAEYLRLLGFPKHHVPGERSRELMEWTRQWYAEHGRPWIFARAAGGLRITDNTICLSDAEFYSERLQTQLVAAEAHDAMLVAVSAGKEC